MWSINIHIYICKTQTPFNNIPHWNKWIIVTTLGRLWFQFVSYFYTFTKLDRITLITTLDRRDSDTVTHVIVPDVLYSQPVAVFGPIVQIYSDIFFLLFFFLLCSRSAFVFVLYFAM